MATEKVSLAILINNENIPTEIFSSSVDKYFGPQMEDFDKSSLVVCILSKSTGFVPAEDNVATYIKSQWLFITSFPNEDLFEFQVVICDKKNWNIIAKEEEMEKREFKTFSIECDKTFLIRIHWNKPETFTIESLTELYSMDESFIRSYYENHEIAGFDVSHQGFPDPNQNLHTIKEDTDETESLVDSLQEERKDNVCYEFSENEEDSLQVKRMDSDKNLSNSGNDSLENSLINEINEDEKNNQNVSVESNLTEDKSEKVEEKTSKTDAELLKEHKEIRMIKIQSILGVKSELHNLQRIDVDNIKKPNSKILIKEENLEKESFTEMNEETLLQTSTIIQSQSYDKVSNLETDDTQRCDGIIHSEPMSVAFSNEAIKVVCEDVERKVEDNHNSFEEPETKNLIDDEISHLETDDTQRCDETINSEPMPVTLSNAPIMLVSEDLERKSEVNQDSFEEAKTKNLIDYKVPNLETDDTQRCDETIHSEPAPVALINESIKVVSENVERKVEDNQNSFKEQETKSLIDDEISNLETDDTERCDETIHSEPMFVALSNEPITVVSEDIERKNEDNQDYFEESRNLIETINIESSENSDKIGNEMKNEDVKESELISDKDYACELINNIEKDTEMNNDLTQEKPNFISSAVDGENDKLEANPKNIENVIDFERVSERLHNIEPICDNEEKENTSSDFNQEEKLDFTKISDDKNLEIYEKNNENLIHPREGSDEKFEGESAKLQIDLKCSKEDELDLVTENMECQYENSALQEQKDENINSLKVLTQDFCESGPSIEIKNEELNNTDNVQKGVSKLVSCTDHFIEADMKSDHQIENLTETENLIKHDQENVQTTPKGEIHIHTENLNENDNHCEKINEKENFNEQVYVLNENYLDSNENENEETNEMQSNLEDMILRTNIIMNFVAEENANIQEKTTELENNETDKCITYEIKNNMKDKDSYEKDNVEDIMNKSTEKISLEYEKNQNVNEDTKVINNNDKISLESNNKKNKEENSEVISISDKIDLEDKKNHDEEEVIETTQPTVENVVEMFERLSSMEEEPHRLSKRYKVENVDFILLKQKFEVENQETEKDENNIQYNANGNNIGNKENDDMLAEKNEILPKPIDNEPERKIRNKDTDINFDAVIIKKDNNKENNSFPVIIDNPVDKKLSPKNNEENKEISEVSDKKIENKENESFSGFTDKVPHKKMSLSSREHKLDIKEINEIGTHMSVKEIKRMVSDKREKLAVNDDYKYPDSVTPTKVEHSLSKSPEYNVPFMDDESFYKENWYEESDDRWTSLERPVLDDQNKQILTPATESAVRFSPKASTESLKEPEENKPRIADEIVKKEPKKRGLISLCGCVGGR